MAQVEETQEKSFDSMEGLFDHLFSLPHDRLPQSGSIQLLSADRTDASVPAGSIFLLLFSGFTKGVATLFGREEYGGKANVLELTEPQLCKLRDYFLTIGFNFQVKVSQEAYSADKEGIMDIELFPQTTGQQLNDFMMKVWKGGQTLAITFFYHQPHQAVGSVIAQSSE